MVLSEIEHLTHAPALPPGGRLRIEIMAKPFAAQLDENELVKSIHNDWDDVIVWDEIGVTTADEFERLVYEQPTIIEAEGGANNASEKG